VDRALGARRVEGRQRPPVLPVGQLADAQVMHARATGLARSRAALIG
jgi:hypothetical protein